MNTVYLGLGGNKGDREKNLCAALEEIRKHCGSITLSSGVYETAPWGSDSKNHFLNMVICLESPLNPARLLITLIEIEMRLGRQRSLQQNEDRTIDIDILFYNDAVYNSPDLQVPHPRLTERRFVLQPLSDIAGEFVHPLNKSSINDLLKRCEDPLPVALYAGQLCCY
jgi:2-amino-4-hydroxy-6-hydroxymethyldihydropteridine diphosphokinase